MKKILGMLIGVGILFGLDYSKMSDQDLIAQAGKFPPSDAIAYYTELDKRASKMTKEQSCDFFLKIREEKIKNEDLMRVGDFKKRKREIKKILSEAMKDRPYTHRALKRAYMACKDSHHRHHQEKMKHHLKD